MLKLYSQDCSVNVDYIGLHLFIFSVPVLYLVDLTRFVYIMLLMFCLLQFDFSYHHLLDFLTCKGLDTSN